MLHPRIDQITQSELLLTLAELDQRTTKLACSKLELPIRSVMPSSSVQSCGLLCAMQSSETVSETRQPSRLSTANWVQSSAGEPSMPIWNRQLSQAIKQLQKKANEKKK